MGADQEAVLIAYHPQRNTSGSRAVAPPSFISAVPGSFEGVATGSDQVRAQTLLIFMGFSLLCIQCWRARAMRQAMTNAFAVASTLALPSPTMS